MSGHHAARGPPSDGLSHFQKRFSRASRPSPDLAGHWPHAITASSLKGERPCHSLRSRCSLCSLPGSSRPCPQAPVSPVARVLSHRPPRTRRFRALRHRLRRSASRFRCRSSARIASREAESLIGCGVAVVGRTAPRVLPFAKDASAACSRGGLFFCHSRVAGGVPIAASRLRTPSQSSFRPIS